MLLESKPSFPWLPLDIEFVGRPFDGSLLCTGLGREAHQTLPPHALATLADPSVAHVTFTTTDHRWLRLAGYEVNGGIYDVQVMAWLLDEAQPLDLESVALRYCGIVMDKRISTIGSRLVFKCDDGKIVDLIDAPRDQLCAYNVRDLEATSALFLELWQRLDDAGMLQHFLEDQVPFTSTLVDMMCRGLPIDIAATREMRADLVAEIETYNRELHDEANLPDAFNLNSGPQLASYLFNKRLELKARVDVPEIVRQAPKAERLTMMRERAPKSFEVESVGLKYAQGRYDLPGLGLKVHVKTDAGAPSTAAPKLRVHYGDNPWVAKYLDMKQRSTIASYLESYERFAVPSEAVSAVQAGVQPASSQGWALGTAEVLQPRVLTPGSGEGQQQPHTNVERLSSANAPWSATHLGTSLCDGAETRATATSNRSGTSHQRDQDGQPAGELAVVRVECGAHDASRSHRLYGRFVQTGTVTGRLSSREPNLQNLPARSDLGKRVRGLIRFEDCYGIHADYSQLEPRLMAHWSQDLVLLDVFRTDKDIYLVTAAYIFGVSVEDVTPTQRGICKTLILALGYGAGAAKVAMILAENGYPTTEATAAGYLKELKQLYRRFFEWKQDVIRGAGVVGYVQTLAGRKRRLVTGEDRAEGGDYWKNADLSETQAANAVIQGSAGDIVQRVMVRSSQQFPDFGLLVQVHDELMWQCEREPKAFELWKLQKLAETGHGFKLTVPLKFEPRVVQKWSDGK